MDVFIKTYDFMLEFSQDDSVLTWKYLKTIHFDSVLNLEILENQSCWFSFEPGNTGKPFILIIWFSCEPGRIGKPIILITCDPWRADRRTGGRVGWLKHLRKNAFWEHVPGENTNIQYIIEGWLFDMISKKTRAEQWLNLAAVSRRDLSYETNSGPKTKTY